MPTKFPLSFSRLNTFEQCPLKFEHLYVNKTVKDQDTVYTEYGTRVHSSLENYAKTSDPETLTQETAKHKGLVDRIVQCDGDKFYEYQMALDSRKQPCDWFADDIWIRGIADVLVVNDKKAYCLDWKTGKVKDNPTQLQLFAYLVFQHFPSVEEVKTSYVWLAHDEMTTVGYKRMYMESIWNALEQRFNRVQEAVDVGVFQAKPSRLCNWCPAKKVCPEAW